MDRLGLMETYIRVLEAGSFSSAARHLNVGQPTVSKSIAQLEKLLGVRLLIRSPRGLKASEAGQTYYEHARRAIAEAEEAAFAARATDARLTGRLRVSAGITFTKLYLVPRLSAFLAAHPNLSVEFVLHDGKIDLIEEGVHIGLRYGPLCDCALVGRRLACTRRLVLGTPDYFRRVGIPTSPAELLDHEAVIYTHDLGGTNAWSFRKDDSETSIPISGRLRLDASEAVRAAVLGGLGFTIASQWIFAPELASGAVRAVLTEWTLPNTELWMVFPMGRMTSAKVRAFAAFVEREIGRPRADWSGHNCDAGLVTETTASIQEPLRLDDCAIELRRSRDDVGEIMTSCL
jgi:DNA-binding transcriptional LysR family regulator